MNKAMEIGDLLSKGWPILVGFLALVAVAFLGYRYWRTRTIGFNLPKLKFGLPQLGFGKGKKEKAKQDVVVAQPSIKVNGKIPTYNAIIYNKNFKTTKMIKLTDIKGDEYPLPRLIGKKPYVILEQLESAQQPEPAPIAPEPAIALKKVKVPREYKSAMKYLEVISGNGTKEAAATSPLELPVMKVVYTEFQPQRLPQKYMHMTPSWLYRKTHWKDKVEFLRIPPDSNIEKLNLWMMIIVIAIFAIVIFLILISMVGG